MIVFFFSQDKFTVHIRHQLFLGTENLFGIIYSRRAVIDVEFTIFSIYTNAHGVHLRLSLIKVHTSSIIQDFEKTTRFFWYKKGLAA